MGSLPRSSSNITLRSLGLLRAMTVRQYPSTWNGLYMDRVFTMIRSVTFSTFREVNCMLRASISAWTCSGMLPRALAAPPRPLSTRLCSTQYASHLPLMYSSVYSMPCRAATTGGSSRVPLQMYCSIRLGSGAFLQLNTLLPPPMPFVHLLRTCLSSLAVYTTAWKCGLSPFSPSSLVTRYGPSHQFKTSRSRSNRDCPSFTRIVYAIYL